MNKESERVEDKTADDSGRKVPAATQDNGSGEEQAPGSELHAGHRQQKTPSGTTARRRKAPFVL